MAKSLITLNKLDKQLEQNISILSSMLSGYLEARDNGIDCQDEIDVLIVSISYAEKKLEKVRKKIAKLYI